MLVWWGHRAHDEVSDELAARVQSRVLAGMGLVALHSSSRSKPFMRLLGTTCSYRWREADDRELIWVVAPGHAIARGLPPVIDVPHHEMYGEPFDIPEPDELVFVSWFSGGEVFRSGVAFAAARADLLPRRRAPGVADLPSAGDPPGARERRRMGMRRRRERASARAAARRDRLVRTGETGGMTRGVPMPCVLYRRA